MKTSFDSLAKLSEEELLDHFASLVARDRRTTTELLVAIAEIDERKLWAAHACSSMFTFCMERFNMSEQTTAKRIWAARTARRFPVILEMVARGDLHLAAIHLLARHLTDENHARVLERAKSKSCRAIDRLVAELAPRADVPSRIRALPGPRGTCTNIGMPAASNDIGRGQAIDAMSKASAAEDLLRDAASHSDRVRGEDWPAPAEHATTGGEGIAPAVEASASRSVPKAIVPLSPRRYKIEITIDEATHDKLRSLQDLLGYSATGRDPAAIISRAIDVLHVRTLARKAGCTNRPNGARAVKPANPAKPANPMKPPRSMDPVRSIHATDSTAPVQSSPPAPTVAKSSSKPTTPAREASAKKSEQRTRCIPASVRREVWQRDSGRCRYVDSYGRRCRETSNVEFHHKDPFALGGHSTVANIELRCAAHNQFQADLDFGRSFMDTKRSRNSATPAFHAECSG